MRKWEIDQYLELGSGVRIARDVGEVVDGESARCRFFLNADLSLRRSDARPEVLEIRDADRIAATGLLASRSG